VAETHLDWLQRFQQSPDLMVQCEVGALRSGTTLFMQWLANTGVFSYPTNILSQFFGAPVIGAKIQFYGEFCENPKKTFDELVAKLELQGCAIDDKYSGSDHFSPVSKLLFSSAEIDQAMRAYQQYYQGKK